jgi:hypothetical protein
MGCECYQIGGRFIAEDPDCPAHGTEAQRERELQERETARLEQASIAMERELEAWRDRFPQYVYRPQDDVVSLRKGV